MPASLEKLSRSIDQVAGSRRVSQSPQQLRGSGDRDPSFDSGTLVRQQIERTMSQHSIGDPARYAQFLCDNPGERRELLRKLLTSVNGLARDLETLIGLEESVSPPSDNADRNLPGTASGPFGLPASTGSLARPLALRESRIADTTWMTRFSELQAYLAEHGDPHVPKTHSNSKLANWVWTQRLRRKDNYGHQERLTETQVKLLEGLGFRWDGNGGRWDEQFAELEAFKRSNGHCDVNREREKYPSLVSWAAAQRYAWKHGTLKPAREAALTNLGFVWERRRSTLNERWHMSYQLLVMYFRAHGNSDIPSQWAGDKQLGKWAAEQRLQRKKNGLTAHKIRLLNAINFTWQRRERGSWEANLDDIVAFRRQHGHCDIPIRSVEHPKLGRFVASMRSKRRQGILSPERIAKLDAIGFQWAASPVIDANGMNDRWRTRLDQLVQYGRIHGNLDVPARNNEFPRLGVWVSQQRQQRKNGKLHARRIQMLDEIGFNWTGRKAKAVAKSQRSSNTHTYQLEIA
ncbi:MAG: hypothetical protein D4S02_01300 [Rhodocyclaceae bacterium]|nr:MAG: hypothetical protein D4S02_01300 [Rhodocyclaceae bacterium]